jgi:hypothetical protein
VIPFVFLLISLSWSNYPCNVLGCHQPWCWLICEGYHATACHRPSFYYFSFFIQSILGGSHLLPSKWQTTIFDGFVLRYFIISGILEFFIYSISFRCSLDYRFSSWPLSSILCL